MVPGDTRWQGQQGGKWLLTPRYIIEKGNPCVLKSFRFATGPSKEEAFQFNRLHSFKRLKELHYFLHYFTL